MKTIYLVASGDSRLSANLKCEPTQAEMERKLTAAVASLGGTVKRAHLFDAAKGHGFIDSQKMGMEVFRSIPADAPVIVAESVWQYSHHVLPGLITHQGPILTVANWSGTWPGLVGLLNLNAGLTKAGTTYSSLWSENFDDDFFLNGLKSWLQTGKVKHNLKHIRPFGKVDVPAAPARLGTKLAKQLRSDKAIMGVFDEGCMGMYNAIVPDELLHKTGVYKERLSQSQLFAKMQTVSDAEARDVLDWLIRRGMTFNWGEDPATELTISQTLEQCKMYVAALRLADQYGCATIGIQYQLGLANTCAASDLVEGLLNNVNRPPVKHETTGKELFKGQAMPHFNEVDECAGLDGLVTNRLWTEMGFDPETTLHDLRWGREFDGQYVWVFLISGAAPPAHFIGGYKGAVSDRQPAMYFAKGGGSLRGVSKPGQIVWSRVFVDGGKPGGKLCFDTGLAEVVELPDAETQERWQLTSPEWPIMHAVLKGITRDQMMARHKSNHIQVAYAPNKAGAKKAMYAKAAAMAELGLEVSICGDV